MGYNKWSLIDCFEQLKIFERGKSFGQLYFFEGCFLDSMKEENEGAWKMERGKIFVLNYVNRGKIFGQ